MRNIKKNTFKGRKQLEIYIYIHTQTYMLVTLLISPFPKIK